MLASLGAITRSRGFGYGVKAALLLSPILYVALWTTVIQGDLLSMMRLPFRLVSSAFTGELVKVQVSARPDVVVWRGGWMPVYWSKLGDLTFYHGVFSIGYVVYLGTSVYKLGIRRLGTRALERIDFLDLETIKKFWVVFGVIAFLTTSMSTISILADLIAFVYYVIYLVGLPLAPFSVYLWWKIRNKREQPHKV
jgi:hypothetical protein